VAPWVAGASEVGLLHLDGTRLKMAGMVSPLVDQVVWVEKMIHRAVEVHVQAEPYLLLKAAYLQAGEAYQRMKAYVYVLQACFQAEVAWVVRALP